MENEERLKRLVLDGSPDAPPLAEKIGPSAIPWLQDQMSHPEDEVRLNTIYCLATIGGPRVMETCLEALFDSHIQVRSAALREMYDHADSTYLTRLLGAYDKSKDSFVRHHLALIMGGMGDAVDVRQLRKRLDREKDAEAREGLATALARLNDKEAQADFILGLHASWDRDRLRYLEHAETIHAPWLLKPLMPLLEDTTPLIYIGIHGQSDSYELAQPLNWTEARDRTRRNGPGGSQCLITQEETIMYRQGDVLLIRVDAVPRETTPRPRDGLGRLVLAQGEATGHAHAVESALAELFEDRDGTLYLRVEADAPEPARLVHEEHAAITLPAGSYRVVRQVEYDPAVHRRVHRD